MRLYYDIFIKVYIENVIFYSKSGGNLKKTLIGKMYQNVSIL